MAREYYLGVSKEHLSNPRRTHVPVEGAAEAGFAKLNRPPPAAGAAAAGAGAEGAAAGSAGLLVVVVATPNEKLGGAALGVEVDPVVVAADSAGLPNKLGVDGAVVLGMNVSCDTRAGG